MICIDVSKWITNCHSVVAGVSCERPGLDILEKKRLSFVADDIAETGISRL